MDFQKLANLLFPDVTQTPEDMENKYPPRNLPEGAKVTRFAPSPTGFVHFGGMFPSRVSERLAHQSGGLLYLRIEDTDSKREVEGAEQSLIETLAYYGVKFDEGAVVGGDSGSYGPYRQSERKDIYHIFAKKLVAEGKAYPCFCTAEELTKTREKQEEEKLDPGYYGKWAACRSLSYEEIEQNIKDGKPFVLRFKSNGSVENKIKYTDLVKGNLELTENDKDHVLLKSDKIPTYHFAHAVDDHLMRTTHVVRGEEWLSSVPYHIQLFAALGFKPPKYLHIAQLMKLENGSKKKLSKRDAGVDMRYYKEKGYCAECVEEYIMTLLNSNFEEWRMQNPQKPFTEFPFSPKKMSVSGCLFDFDKLCDVSKNTVSRMSAEEVYEEVLQWAKEFDDEFYTLLNKDKGYATSILAIGRGGKKPRKDLYIWSEVREYMGFFYDELFVPSTTYPEPLTPQICKSIFEKYIEAYNDKDDQNEWFEKIKKIAEELSFATDMKQFKQSPESFKGSIADIAMALRIAVTGKEQSPDTYAVMQVMGAKRVLERLEKAKESL